MYRYILDEFEPASAANFVRFAYECGRRFFGGARSMRTQQPWISPHLSPPSTNIIQHLSLSLEQDSTMYRVRRTYVHNLWQAPPDSIALRTLLGQWKASLTFTFRILPIPMQTLPDLFSRCFDSTWLTSGTRNSLIQKVVFQFHSESLFSLHLFKVTKKEPINF